MTAHGDRDYASVVSTGPEVVVAALDELVVALEWDSAILSAICSAFADGDVTRVETEEVALG